MKKDLVYLGGDIMTFGSNLAREYEYEEFKKLDLPVDVYSPVMNKEINDKSNVTVEENNHLAEKICEQDIQRLWNSDAVVMCPEQHAIGSMCELGTLYGWKYAWEHLKDLPAEEVKAELERLGNKDIYCHYFDIRTNHLPEIDWRRSFGINQMLYGMILYVSKHPEGLQSFASIMEELKEKYKGDE